MPGRKTPKPEPDLEQATQTGGGRCKAPAVFSFPAYYSRWGRAVGMKSYLCKTSVDFGQAAKFLIRPGDILVYDPANQNKVTVYRGGEIAKVLPNQSPGGLAGLAKSGWIVEIRPPKHEQSPRSPLAAPQTPPGGPKAPGNGKGAAKAG